jgi:hypothetical protein
MSSIENIVCGKMTWFTTQDQAQRANDEYNKTFKYRNDVTDPCLLCGKWHLGTEVRSKQLQNVYDRYNLGK